MIGFGAGTGPPSTTPNDTVEKAEELAGVILSEKGSDSDDAGDRRSALGPLMGLAANVGTTPVRWPPSASPTCGRGPPTRGSRTWCPIWHTGLPQGRSST